MTDVVFKDGSGYRKPDVKYVDMGDGTFAERVVVDGGGGGGGGGGASTIADGADVAQGARADAAASSDTGTFSLIALFKRSLGNWTTLLARTPTLVSGRMPVDGSGVTQPVSGPLTDTQLRATAVPVSGPLTSAQLTTAALATNATAQAIRDRLPSTLANNTRLNVETLGVPGVARQLAAGATSANTALTSGVGRISIHARGADIRYAVGSSAQTANATTSHFIAAGERLDIDVPSTPNIAVIRAGATSGTLEVTELS